MEVNVEEVEASGQNEGKSEQRLVPVSVWDAAQGGKGDFVRGERIQKTSNISRFCQFVILVSSWGIDATHPVN